MHLSPDVAAHISGDVAQILLPAIVSLAALALNELRRWLAARTHNTTVQGTMSVAADLVMTIVQKLEQTTVQAIRDSDGKLDDKTAARVREQALSELMGLYGTNGLKDLAKRLGTTQSAVLQYIGALIEQAVYLIKHPPAAPVTFDPDVFGGMTPAEKLAAQSGQKVN